jgi:hypothetical protein
MLQSKYFISIEIDISAIMVWERVVKACLHKKYIVWSDSHCSLQIFETTWLIITLTTWAYCKLSMFIFIFLDGTPYLLMHSYNIFYFIFSGKIFWMLHLPKMIKKTGFLGPGKAWVTKNLCKSNQLGTIHLRRRHVLGGERSKICQICRRIVLKNCRR